MTHLWAIEKMSVSMTRHHTSCTTMAQNSYAHGQAPRRKTKATLDQRSLPGQTPAASYTLCPHAQLQTWAKAWVKAASHLDTAW